MKTLGVRIFSGVLTVATAGMIAGCDDRTSPSNVAAIYPGIARAAVHSWMAPNASSGDLLYVSGGCGGICVFSYPSGRLVGELGDEDEPMGECVDASGDVFVANFGYDQEPGIYEYAHGGTSPIAELSDPGYNPEACSIDPATGNLAVTGNAGFTNGAVAIYTGAQGDPTDYADPNLSVMWFCGYDDKGNLFVDGFDQSLGAGLGELPAGRGNFKNITLSQQSSSLKNIQWVGKYLAVAASSSVIYHVKVFGTRGKVFASTLLNGPEQSDAQFWIRGDTIISPYEMSSYSYGVGLWKYPAGGRIRKSITGSQFEYGEPFAAVVSPANK